MIRLHRDLQMVCEVLTQNETEFCSKAAKFPGAQVGVPRPLGFLWSDRQFACDLSTDERSR